MAVHAGNNLKAWLFRILRNLYLNRQRSMSARAETVPFDALDANLGLADRQANPIERAVIVKAQVEDVLAAFRGLPAAYAAPLHLTAVEGLTYLETARILDIPIGTVMSRVYRGRQLLLTRLGKRTP